MSAEANLARRLAEVRPVDAGAAAAARARQDRLVKPPGSLGRLEDLGAWLASIAGRCPPPVPERPAAVVCAGDHGVLAQQVSAWPAEVTAAMAGELCAERAAASALTRVAGASLEVLDVGIAGELSASPGLERRKIRPGTGDIATGPAMSREQAARAVQAGLETAGRLVEEGVDLLVTGDMGIGNTTPASCLIAAFTGRRAEEVTGPGAGGDAAQVAHKAEVVRWALERHAPDPADPLGTLAAVGGLEHAAIAGLVLGAAIGRVPLILDGVSTVAAGLAARALSPEALGCAVAGHRSTEPGAAVALDSLGMAPLLDLGMRLGEGTGALLAVPLVRSAAAILSQMATFEEAGIAA